MLKTDVHCVWLAKGGRKRSKVTRIQLIIHSTRHGINITLTGLDSVSIFQNIKKKGAIFKKVRCIV